MTWERLAFELAGHVGVDPWSYTLRELLWMSDAKDAREWNHTSSLMALIYNRTIFSDRDKAMTPAKFHPFAARWPKPKKRMGTIDDLKVFLPNVKR